MKRKTDLTVALSQMAVGFTICSGFVVGIALLIIGLTLYQQWNSVLFITAGVILVISILWGGLFMLISDISDILVEIRELLRSAIGMKQDG